jgi:hypothetical protein
MSLIPPLLAEDDGLEIWMYFELYDRHKQSHIHVFYDNEDTVYSLDGEVLEGEKLKGKRHRRVISFIKNNKDALDALWYAFKQGNNTKDKYVFKV